MEGIMDHEATPKQVRDFVDETLAGAEELLRENMEGTDDQPFLALLSAQMGGESAEVLNLSAYWAGLYYVRAARAAAEHETGRKGVQLQVADALQEELGCSKTEAEKRARDDDRYLGYVEQGEALKRDRDVAAVLYDSLRERARLFSRIDPAVVLEDFTEKAHRAPPPDVTSPLFGQEN